MNPLPDDCLPSQRVIDEMLAGPTLDADGKITSGTFAGMTPAEVRADRDAFNRASTGWMRKILDA